MTVHRRMTREQGCDYIIVGGGTAGCIMAARLSEDPDVHVLLLEAGGPDRSPLLAMPGALPLVYQRSALSWGYRSGPEPELGGRTIDEKAGRVLGGSSSINAMIFNRGNPLDYEGWAAEGLPDWDYAHCLPYFRRMETFAEGPDEWRGGEGPVRVGRAPARHKLFDAFLEAGRQAGHDVAADHNGYRQEGMHIAQTFIHDGVRSSSPRAYLRPAMRRPNLRVVTGAHVSRILVSAGTATGVEVTAGRHRHQVRCTREVIVTAGALNTPKLLLLSGLGDAGALRGLGITPVAHIPAVGQNLQNHPGVDVQFAADDEDSLTAQLTPFGRARLAAEWSLRRRGLGAANYFEAGAFLRGRDDVPFPNLQYEFLPLTRRLQGGRLIPIPGFQVWVDLSRPGSRGSLTLRSADPAAPPLTVFRTYSCHQDLLDMIAAVRQTRELVGQPALARFRRAELSPGPDAVSDAEIAAFVRRATGTSYHPSGTCRMGGDEDSVVDGEGRVRQVSGLRIADASIIPRVVTANLNAPVMMIAEKIADHIRGRQLPPSDAPFHRRGQDAERG